MDLGLKNKIIIVTGGARGIGEGIVTALANEGAIPIIIGRNEDDNLKCLKNITNLYFNIRYYNYYDWHK